MPSLGCKKPLKGWKLLDCHNLSLGFINMSITQVTMHTTLTDWLKSWNTLLLVQVNDLFTEEIKRIRSDATLSTIDQSMQHTKFLKRVVTLTKENKSKNNKQGMHALMLTQNEFSCKSALSLLHDQSILLVSCFDIDTDVQENQQITGGWLSAHQKCVHKWKLNLWVLMFYDF